MYKLITVGSKLQNITAEEMTMLPNDPIMLMSVINTKLRDFYPSLESLCEDLDISVGELTQKLKMAGFTYDSGENRFK